VLICIARNPAARIQEISEQVGITYRGVQRIVRELEEAGYLSHTRDAADARANVYRIDASLPLRHPLERHRRVAALLELGSR
jgi:DNA-binding MarR family transcriptional regulator